MSQTSFFRMKRRVPLVELFIEIEIASLMPYLSEVVFVVHFS